MSLFCKFLRLCLYAQVKTVTNKIEKSLLYSGGDSTPSTSLDSPLMVVEESNRAAAENTVTCKEERHAEVAR